MYTKACLWQTSDPTSAPKNEILLPLENWETVVQMHQMEENSMRPQIFLA